MSDAPKSLTVFNYETQQAETLPESELEQAVLSGKVGLPKDKPVYVVSPEGVPGTVQPGELAEALRSGFKYDPIDSVTARQRTKAAEAAPVQSAVEGAARGLSFSLSDQALKGLGADMEAVKARSQTAPGIAGEFAGIIAPTVASGGTSLLARGAATAGKAVIGVNKAALATERMVAKTLQKVGTEAANKSVTKKLVNNLIAKGAGGAVEGAAYGAGQLIKEDALGDAELNAETLLSSVGTGAVLGGAIGSAFGGIQALAPIGVSASKKVGKAITDRAPRYTDKQLAAAELVGLSPSQYGKLKRVMPKALEENLRFIQENSTGILQSNRSLAEIYQQAHIKAGITIKNTLEGVQTALDNSRISIKRAAVYEPVVDKLTDIIKRHKDSAGFDTFVKQLNKLRKSYVSRLNDPSKVRLSEIQQVRQDADRLIKFTKEAKDRPLVQQGLYEVRTVLRGTIDDMAEFASKLDPQYANLATDLKKANRDYFVTSVFKDGIANKVDKEKIIPTMDVLTGGVGYLLGGQLGLAVAGTRKLLESDLRRKYIVLSGIERSGQKFNKRLNSAVKTFFAPAASIRPVTAKILLESKIAADPKTGKKPKTREEGYRNTVKLINKLNQDPDFSVKRISGAAARVAQAAPKTALAAQDTMIRATNFLAQKVPRKAAPAGVLNLLNPEIPLPSTMELAKFENYLAVVDNPAVVLDQLESGTLTRESVEALKAVYPATFAKVQEGVMSQVASAPDKITYAKKIQLGILLDIPADTSMLPQNVMALQQNFRRAEAEEQERSVKPTQGGLKGLNAAGRAQTDTQRVQKGE